MALFFCIPRPPLSRKTLPSRMYQYESQHAACRGLMVATPAVLKCKRDAFTCRACQAAQ